jgi:hypothetical protein
MDDELVHVAILKATGKNFHEVFGCGENLQA